MGGSGTLRNRAYTRPIMVALRRALTLVAFLLGTLSLAAPASGAGDHVARMHLDGVIDQITATYIQEGLKASADGGAAAVIIEIDSPGGDLVSMDDMLKAILASPIPVITWVAPEGGGAGSAATFITLSGDVAAMAPSTSIGAAAVVGSGGADLPTTEAEKVTNFYAAKIHQLAAAHNRNTDWAESAVRKAASLGAADAIKLKPPVVDLLASTEAELFAAIDTGVRADGYAYRHDGKPLPKLSGLADHYVNMNPGQSLLQLLSDPNLAFILFTIGFYGILAELFHPNYLSGTLGAIAIVLAFIGSGSLPLNLGWADPDSHWYRPLRARPPPAEPRPSHAGRGGLLHPGRLRPVDRRDPRRGVDSGSGQPDPHRSDPCAHARLLLRPAPSAHAHAPTGAYSRPNPRSRGFEGRSPDAHRANGHRLCCGRDLVGPQPGGANRDRVRHCASCRSRAWSSSSSLQAHPDRPPMRET